MPLEQSWPVSITLRISESLNQKLKEQAKKEQCSISAVVRRILAERYGVDQT